MSVRFTKPPQGVDKLLLDYLPRPRTALPARRDIRIAHPGGSVTELDYESYVAVDGALAALQTGRNEQVMAVHKRVSERLQLRWSVWEHATGPGYARTEPHTVDAAAVRAFRYRNPHSLAGIVAEAYALERKEGDSQLRRHAALAVGVSGATPPALVAADLYAQSRKFATLYPRVDQVDELAVGLMGAYLRTAQRTPRARQVLKLPIRELTEQQLKASDNVYDHIQRETEKFGPYALPELYTRIGRLSFQYLGIRYGAMLDRPLAEAQPGPALCLSSCQEMTPQVAAGDYYVVPERSSY